MKEFRCDKLLVEIFPDRKELGKKAGSDAAHCLLHLLEKQDTVNIMFAAAPSQNETLAALISCKDIDWKRVNAFHMDEYAGIEAGNPASFRSFLNNAVFKKAGFGNVFLIDAESDHPESVIERYSRLLEEHPLDICMLGVGENGHIAFNDPGVADFDDPERIKIVKLDDVCRMQQVHDGCFRSIDDVPRMAYTVTIPAIMQSKHLFCSVPSGTKAAAVRRMLDGPVDESCPATILRRGEDSRLYLDQESAKLLDLDSPYLA